MKSYNGLKLGKLPYEEDKLGRDLKLDKYLNTALFLAVNRLPTPPESTDDYQICPAWGMYRNDVEGDCAIAGAIHLLMLWIKEAGGTPNFTDENAEETYSAISGYVPGDEDTDVGCQLRDVLKYWKNAGIPDAHGVRHKIAGFIQADPKNNDQIKIAQYLFGGLYIGFMVPAYAMTEFQDGQPWTLQKKNTKIVGGHCVDQAGYGSIQILAVTDTGVWVLTWGKVQFMDWKFWDKLVDEVWVILDKEFLKKGVSPRGFDLKTLQADLKAIDAMD